MTELDHGQTVTVAGGKLELTGTAGRRPIWQVFLAYHVLHGARVDSDGVTR